MIQDKLNDLKQQLYLRLKLLETTGILDLNIR